MEPVGGPDWATGSAATELTLFTIGPTPELSVGASGRERKMERVNNS